jgi:hypothetical protein
MEDARSTEDKLRSRQRQRGKGMQQPNGAPLTEIRLWHAS